MNGAIHEMYHRRRKNMNSLVKNGHLEWRTFRRFKQWNSAPIREIFEKVVPVGIVLFPSKTVSLYTTNKQNSMIR